MCMKRFFICFLSLVIFISCKNDVDLFSDPPSNKISIEITGDENVIINTENIEIKRESKWKNVKRKVLRCIKYKKGYVFACSFLGEEELNDDYVFNHDSSIYITSKLRNSKPDRDIKLTLMSDEYIEIDDAELIIKIDTTWQEIKDDVNAKLKFQHGYTLSKWKLGKSKNGKILNENHVFKRSCTIYAVSKKIEEKSIILNLIGGENVELQYTSLEVIFGSTWLEIKDSKYISAVKANEGYNLSEWKIENYVNGKTISNDYIFNTNTTLYVFAIKDNCDEPYLPDIPPNIEIDDLGMVTITPPTNGINGIKIDYPLCNYPKRKDERLWHGVFKEGTTTNIAPYKINQYETTYKLWKEVYEWAILNGYVFENIGHRGGGVDSENTNDNQPVTALSYRDCLIWCNAYTEKINNNVSQCVYLEAKNGNVLKNAKEEKNGENLCDNAYMDFTRKGMRLPTEAEWEYAARLQPKTRKNATLYGSVYLTKLNSASGANLPICTPNIKKSNIEDMSNELRNTTVCSKFYNGHEFEYFKPEVTKTNPVGSKRANQLGLYDMSGNVSEWCSDITTEEILLDSSRTKSAVVRGGTWYSLSCKCSVGYRDARYTFFFITTIGFRLCQTK